MPIRNWHVGKVGILWAWGIAVCFVIIQVVVRTSDFVLGFILIGAVVAILLSLSVVTWKWFSGKEQ